jgi:hypothetical protein
MRKAVHSEKVVSVDQEKNFPTGQCDIRRLRLYRSAKQQACDVASILSGGERSLAAPCT